ncbi:MAG: carboxypeptidase-like regulatory domain-containing protein [Candidatus Sumerlaeota bacterium]|nr:carboxypeptidase-like regulatory domain-containing protein [Candidatus Sumerlaeota bacterium]
MDTSAPLANYTVHYKEYGDPEMDEHVTYKDSDGRFAFRNLTKGVRYALLFQAKGYPMREERDVIARPKDKATELTFLMYPEMPLEGMVYDLATSKPIEGALVLTFIETPSHGARNDAFEDIFYRGIRATTNPNGRFVLNERLGSSSVIAKGYLESSIPYGSWESRRWGFGGYWRGLVNKETSSDTAILIGLAKHSRIRLNITLDGKPARDAKVEFDRYSKRRDFEFRWEESSQCYVCDDLPQGRYGIRVELPDHDYSAEALLSPGQECVLHFSIDSTGTCALSGPLLGAIDEPTSRIRITLEDPVWRDTETHQHRAIGAARINEQRSYRIPGIPAGAYLLRTSGEYLRESSEEATVQGETMHPVRIFKYYVLMGKLFFDNKPESWPAPFLTRVWIPYLGDDRIAYLPDHIMTGGNEYKCPANTIFLCARLRGEYCLCLENARGTPNDYLIRLPYKLDTSNGDQDLGDIHIDLSRKCALLGSVRNALGLPARETRVFVQRVEDIPNRHYDGYFLPMDAQGRFGLCGLDEGEYRIRIFGERLKRDSDSCKLTEYIRLKGTMERNFVIGEEHLVFAHLAPTPDDVPKTWRQPDKARLKAVKLPPMRDNVSEYSSEFECNNISGQMVFCGRLKGEYAIELIDGDRVTRAPGVFRIDNTKGDQDIGVVNLSNAK